MDDFNLVKATAAEMVAQDNRSSQYPLFVVRVRVKRPVGSDMAWDIKERRDADYVNEKSYCSDCRKAAEAEGSDGIPEKCEFDLCDDDTYAYYELDWENDLKAGVFFTAKACDQHIAENKHHYKEGYSYGIAAWRNPEMQAVMRTIIKVDGAEVPNYYA